jgi:hypothetical protein
MKIDKVLLRESKNTQNSCFTWEQKGTCFLIWAGWPNKLAALETTNQGSKLYTGPEFENETELTDRLRAYVLAVCKGDGFAAIACQFKESSNRRKA